MKYILFDIDGTLWNSIPEVTASWNLALAGQKETAGMRLSEADVKATMGHTNEEIAEMVMPQLPKERREEIFQVMSVQEFSDLAQKGGSFYPGTRETLKALAEKGYFLGIVSNCGDGYIEVMLKHSGFTDRIADYECSGRTGHPKGDNIRLVLERNGADPEEMRQAVYVGDTAMDEEASRAAGVRFVYAAYGFGEVRNPDAVLDDIRELPELLKRMF